MTDPTDTLEDIRNIFSILHDGTTSTWTGDRNLLSLKINSDWLAKLIDKSYKSFYIQCGQIDKIEFRPWMNPSTLPQILLTEIDGIFKASLEILSADIESDFVKIICNQHNTDFDYCGGTLLLNCKSIKIFDQDNRQVSLDHLNSIYKSYCDDFSKEIEQSIIVNNNRG